MYRCLAPQRQSDLTAFQIGSGLTRFLKKMWLCRDRSCGKWVFLLLLLKLVLLITPWPVGTERNENHPRKKPINVLLLLPMNNKYMFSYAHMRPALEIALEKLEATSGLLPGHYLRVHYNDTSCNEAVSTSLSFIEIVFWPVLLVNNELSGMLKSFCRSNDKFCPNSKFLC